MKEERVGLKFDKIFYKLKEKKIVQSGILEVTD